MPTTTATTTPTTAINNRQEQKQRYTGENINEAKNKSKILLDDQKTEKCFSFDLCSFSERCQRRRRQHSGNMTHTAYLCPYIHIYTSYSNNPTAPATGEEKKQMVKAKNMICMSEESSASLWRKCARHFHFHLHFHLFSDFPVQLYFEPARKSQGQLGRHFKYM